MTIDERINSAFAGLSETVSGIVFYSSTLDFSTPQGGSVSYDLPIILLWLAAGSFFFTFYLGFINIRYFKHAIDLVRGRFDSGSRDGQISRFQALATSLSGTIGLGNIAGVAVAISVGGPGATLWIIVMGFFSMALKFAEVACGVKYRHHPDPENPQRISGGPMYYLRDSFRQRGIPYIGSFLGGVFAIACIFGSIGAGPLFQSNQAYQQLVNVTGGEPASVLSDKGWLVGLALACCAGLVIIGGIKSIARVTERLVPFMAIIYIALGLLVIGLHIHVLPEAILTVFQSAFAPEAGVGGIIGAMLMGIRRAAFSNEAGLGTAAIVHSAVQTDKPITQGFVGMLGPFIDTVVICTITALVIVITGAYDSTNGNIEGVQLTSRAIGEGVSWGPYVLALVVVLFAFSTLLTWSYYGVKATTFLFGERRSIEMLYKALFLAFIVVGASSNLGKVVGFTDAMVFLMSVPNIIGLYFLAPELKRDVNEYRNYRHLSMS